MAKKKIYNRIKLILVEKERTNYWLAEKLNKSNTTVSRWCTNDMQPALDTLYKIAEVLEVEIYDLLQPLGKVTKSK